MKFHPHYEGDDNFIETYEGFQSRLHSDPVLGHQKFVPMPSEALLTHFYNGVFIRSPGGVVSAELEFTPKVLAFAKALKHRAEQLGVGADFTAHDVGCGFGALVHAFQQIDVKASGSEANRAWVDAANPFCQNKLSADPLEETLKRLGYKVDLFSIYHVLEHLPDPAATLKVVASHLSENGVVDIQVPNAQSFRVLVGGRRNDPQYTFPQHLHYFSAASMISLIREAGLEPISLWTRPLFENGYDETPAGWEAALSVPKDLVISAEAWANAASENLLGGELLVVAALGTNKTAPRNADIDWKAQKALQAFAEGRKGAEGRKATERRFAEMHQELAKTRETRSRKLINPLRSFSFKIFGR
jgi:SAM-dependent methyltransferase